MCNLESFKIDLNEVVHDVKTIEYDLDDDFFKAIEAPDVKRGKVHVNLTISNEAGVYELNFHCEGAVIVACDICLDDMQQPVTSDNRLIARLGDDYSDNDDLITVNREEGIIDVSWYIYEFIMLSIPIKHVHKDGECNPRMLEIINKHMVDRDNGGNTTIETAIDPRWNELRKLKQ